MPMRSGIQLVTDPVLVEAVSDFLERPEIRAPLEKLRRRLPAEAEIVVAGGALRNVFMEVLLGAAPPTRDVDLFIGGLEADFDLAAALRGEAFHPTDLKGWRWHPAGAELAWDLCLLPDFLVIAAYGLAPTLENLLAGIDLTINAVAWDLRRGRLLEQGCRAAVQARTIAFNSPRIPDKGLMAYRILLMAHKTGFHLARPVFDFLRTRLEVETLSHLRSLLRAKQGRAAAKTLLAAYDDLVRYPSYEAYRSGRRP